MNIRRTFTFAAVFTTFFAALGGSALAQPAAGAAPTRPSFEVATIKPASLAALTPQALMAGQVRLGLTVTGSRVDIGLMSLAELVRTAYDVKPHQVVGPDWMASARFDITAKLPDGATKADVNPMLQTLLAERFGLAMHREKKDRPVFALVVARGGPKLKPSAPEADAPPAANAPPPLMSLNGATVSQPTQTRDGGINMMMTTEATGPVKMTMTMTGAQPSMHYEALKITMPAFADVLTPMMERPVVDMTELPGTYQLSFDIAMAEMMAIAQRSAALTGISMPTIPAGALGGGAGPGAAAEPAGGGSIQRSVQELGLRLDSRDAPVDVIVVDAISKTPSED